jgi:hypothetical protein|tara:strand:+ start:284 stop:592 length:309 start_codon:yes stop_codon:yes gene_type:complete
MAKTITIEITDLQEKILYNDLKATVVALQSQTGSDNEGLKDWVEAAVAGKINNVWKRMRTEWTTRLMDDSDFTDAIPSNQADFVALVTARDDYKTRQERDDA